MIYGSVCLIHIGISIRGRAGVVPTWLKVPYSVRQKKKKKKGITLECKQVTRSVKTPNPTASVSYSVATNTKKKKKGDSSFVGPTRAFTFFFC